MRMRSVNSHTPLWINMWIQNPCYQLITSMIPTCQQVTFTHQPTPSQHRINKRIQYAHIYKCVCVCLCCHLIQILRCWASLEWKGSSPIHLILDTTMKVFLNIYWWPSISIKQKKHMTGLYPKKPADSFMCLLPDSHGPVSIPLSPWSGSEKRLSQLLLPIVFASSFHQLVPPGRPVPNWPEFEAASVVGGLFPTVIKALWVYF